MSSSRLSHLRTVHLRSYATAASRAPLSGLSAAARPKAEQISKEWKGTSAAGHNTKNFIGGEFVESKATKWIDVLDPVRVARFLPAPLRSIRLTRHASQPKHYSRVFPRQHMQNSSKRSMPPLRHSRRGATPVCSLVRDSCWSTPRLPPVRQSLLLTAG